MKLDSFTGRAERTGGTAASHRLPRFGRDCAPPPPTPDDDDFIKSSSLSFTSLLLLLLSKLSCSNDVSNDGLIRRPPLE
jgi:hypothetical protein